MPKYWPSVHDRPKSDTARPSEYNRIKRTGPKWQMKPNRDPLTSSLRQTFIVRSCDALYMRSLPPHFMHVTDCVWLDRLRTHVPMIVSQILIVVSFDELARNRQSSFLKRIESKWTTNELGILASYMFTYKCRGCQQRHVIHCRWADRVLPIWLPVSGFQIIIFDKVVKCFERLEKGTYCNFVHTRLFLHADASFLPSGDHATHRTQFLWPFKNLGTSSLLKSLYQGSQGYLHMCTLGFQCPNPIVWLSYRQNHLPNAYLKIICVFTRRPSSLWKFEELVRKSCH